MYKSKVLPAPQDSAQHLCTHGLYLSCTTGLALPGIKYPGSSQNLYLPKISQFLHSLCNTSATATRFIHPHSKGQKASPVPQQRPEGLSNTTAKATRHTKENPKGQKAIKRPSLSVLQLLHRVQSLRCKHGKKCITAYTCLLLTSAMYSGSVAQCSQSSIPKLSVW